MVVVKGYRDGGIGTQSHCLMCRDLQFGKMETIDTDGGAGHTILGMYLMPINCILKNC